MLGSRYRLCPVRDPLLIRSKWKVLLLFATYSLYVFKPSVNLVNNCLFLLTFLLYISRHIVFHLFISVISTKLELASTCFFCYKPIFITTLSLSILRLNCTWPLYNTLIDNQRAFDTVSYPNTYLHIWESL